MQNLLLILGFCLVLGGAISLARRVPITAPLQGGRRVDHQQPSGWGRRFLPVLLLLAAAGAFLAATFV